MKRHVSEKQGALDTEALLRERGVELLEKALHGDVHTTANSALAHNIETAVYHAFDHQIGDQYKEQIRSLYSNLKANRELRENVLNGHTTADRLAMMSHTELATEERRRADIRLHEETLRDTIGSDREDIEPRPPFEIRHDMVMD